MDWIGKGYSEESTTLPCQLQWALTMLTMKVGEKPLKGGINPSFCLFGTAKAYDLRAEYAEAMRNSTRRGDYYREVMPGADSTEITSNTKIAPEAVQINAAEGPNFAKKVMSYFTKMNKVGLAQAEAFEAKDQQAIWLMCHDARERAWVGGKEIKSPITSTGLRQRWTKLGDLATPLYEYGSQTGGYGDATDTDGKYQCMWKNYLSRVPLI